MEAAVLKIEHSTLVCKHGREYPILHLLRHLCRDSVSNELGVLPTGGEQEKEDKAGRKHARGEKKKKGDKW